MDENSINDFVEEGIETEEVEEENQTEETADQPQKTEDNTTNNEEGGGESVSEATEQVKSFLEADAAAEEDSSEKEDANEEAQVPAHVVKKLREERRQLRERLEELEGNTRPDAANSEVAEDDDFSNIDDDDFLTGAQVKETIRKQNAAIQKRIEQAMSQKEKQAAQQEKLTQIDTLTKQVAQQHEDFGDVTKYGQSLLTKADQSAIRQADNPAEALYARCKERLTEDTKVRNKLLGIEDTQTKNKPADTPKTQEEILQTPDEVFDEVFGGGGG